MRIPVVTLEESAGVLTGIALIVRLATLHLQRVYRVFCLYLGIDVIITAFAVVASSSNQRFYFEAWLIYTVLCWILYPFIVYNLLDSILANRQGILRFSRRLIIGVFVVAGVASALSAGPEYRAGGINGLLGAALVIERTMCTVEFLVLASILGFLRWFPIEIPRNLANLSVGFLIYFGANSMLPLVRSFLSHESYAAVGHAISLIGTGCYVFWIFAISAPGEIAPVRMRQRLRSDERDRLLQQLDAMNAALLRSARR